MRVIASLLVVLSLLIPGRMALAKMTEKELDRCALAAINLADIKLARYKKISPWPYKKSFETVKREECAAAKAIQGCDTALDILCGHNPPATSTNDLASDCVGYVGMIESREHDAFFGSHQAISVVKRNCGKLKRAKENAPADKTCKFVPKVCEQPQYQ